jgi:predicted alpha/beta hydrolase family esterase
VAQLAQCWGAELIDAGEVGHLNPAAGFGPWADALPLIDGLVRERV